MMTLLATKSVWARLVASTLGVSLAVIPILAQTGSQKQTPEEYADSEGYQVLSGLLARSGISSGRTLVLSPETSSGSQSGAFNACKTIPDDFEFAANDFEKQNRKSWLLAKKFSLSFPYEFLDRTKKKEPLPQVPGEQEFTIPLGDLFVVSAVGFDKSRTHAIAYLALYGNGEGSGGYHLLTKNKYGWGEVDGSPACVWMSFNSTESRAGSYA